MSWFKFVVLLFPVLFWSYILMCRVALPPSSLCLVSRPLCCLSMFYKVKNNKYLSTSLCSKTCTTILLSVPKKDLICPNKNELKCNRPKIPGCSTTYGRILPYESQHAFLAILTRSPHIPHIVLNKNRHLTAHLTRSRFLFHGILDFIFLYYSSLFV